MMGPCCTVCYFSSCAATPQFEFWEAIYTKDTSYWPSFLTSQQDTSLTISHSHLKNLPSTAGERAKLCILKEQRAYLSCKGLDILHFCLFVLFFFFYLPFSLKVQCFCKNSGMRFTAPFLSARLIMDAPSVRWDNPLFAPLWVALASPQIQPDETRRHAVGFLVHCVAQHFQTGLEGGGRCG